MTHDGYDNTYREVVRSFSQDLVQSEKIVQRRAGRGKAGGLTMVIPHNSISRESQMLGRNLLRNTLLGTYRNTVRTR